MYIALGVKRHTGCMQPSASILLFKCCRQVYLAVCTHMTQCQCIIPFCLAVFRLNLVLFVVASKHILKYLVVTCHTKRLVLHDHTEDEQEQHGADALADSGHRLKLCSKWQNSGAHLIDCELTVA